MRGIVLFLIVLPVLVCGQSALPNANLICVNGVTFSEVCNKLLDSGYFILKKDSELKTLQTEPRSIPKNWNGVYVINVRVKDSTAFISGAITIAGGELWKDQRIYNQVDKKGNTLPKSMFGYSFLLLKEFALSFHKDLVYLKQ